MSFPQRCQPDVFGREGEAEEFLLWDFASENLFGFEKSSLRAGVSKTYRMSLLVGIV